MEGMQYLDLIHTYSPLFYFIINRMMDVKVFIGIIGAVISTIALIFIMECTRKDIEDLSKHGLAILILLSGPILLVIAMLIPSPDTLRHVIAVSLMDPISVLDLESYREAVKTIEQFIKETY
jgi:membrane-associated HD superfamily phosphohydrolase